MDMTPEIKAEFQMFVPEDDGSAMDWLENTLTQELQKAREELLEEMEAFTFEACPYEGTMMRAFIRSKHSELDHLPVQEV